MQIEIYLSASGIVIRITKGDEVIIIPVLDGNAEQIVAEKIKEFKDELNV